jgi:ABC-type nitrate/sulfonate/bicarbonate transport system substrate-binding protein
VKWNLFQGGDLQLQAMRAGALDLASSSEIPPIFSAADGKPNFKVVAVQRGTTLNQEVVVPKGSKVTDIAGLKGKKVGYVQNTTAHYFLYELLKQAGLTWSDIDAKPLLPNDGLAALNGGSIDAFASYGTSIITAHQQGATTVGSGADILSGNFLWSARDSVLKSPAQRAAAADLIARITKAYAYVRDGHEDGFAKVTADATHQPVAQAKSDLVAAQKQRPDAGPDGRRRHDRLPAEGGRRLHRTRRAQEALGREVLLDHRTQLRPEEGPVTARIAELAAGYDQSGAFPADSLRIAHEAGLLTATIGEPTAAGAPGSRRARGSSTGSARATRPSP